MLTIGIIGSGARARAVNAEIVAGAGMVPGEAATAGALVVAGDTTAETLALLPEALRAGKPTLCLALPGDNATLDGLIALADRHGAALSLPNALRYHPATIALRETLQRGEAGPLLSAFLAWRTSAENGEPLATLGPAALDLLGWLLPAPIVRTQVTRAALFGTAPDTVALLLRDETGLVRTVELITDLPPTLEFDHDLLIEVLGEEAALRAEPFNQAITIAGAATRRRQDWSVETIAPILADFAAALDANGPLPGPPAELRATLALLDGLET
jgi:predicted dehydrogenase